MVNVCFGGKFRQKRTIALGTGSGPMLGFVVIISPWKSCQPRLSMRTRWHNRLLYTNNTRFAASHGGFPRLDDAAALRFANRRHHAVRTDAGMFDVSHMTIVVFAAAAPGSFCVICWRTMWRTHQKRQSPLLGDVECLWRCEDDLIVYYFTEDFFRLVVNSAPAKKTSPGLPNTLNLSASKYRS